MPSDPNFEFVHTRAKAEERKYNRLEALKFYARASYLCPLIKNNSSLLMMPAVICSGPYSSEVQLALPILRRTLDIRTQESWHVDTFCIARDA